MFYWIAIIFVTATLLGLNLHKRDDYRDSVVMPKIEPTVSRAITQHRMAQKYFNSSYYEMSTRDDGTPIPPVKRFIDEDYANVISAKIDGEMTEIGQEIANINTMITALGSAVPVPDDEINKLNEQIETLLERRGVLQEQFDFIELNAERLAYATGGNLPAGPLGVGVDPDNFRTALLRSFAPHGFVLRGEAGSDITQDPVTRFLCVDLRNENIDADCDEEILNKNAPGGTYRKVGYIVTYMPIPEIWNTPYYENMIVNSIKRLSDNSFSYGIVRAIPDQFVITDVAGYEALTRTINTVSNDNSHGVYAVGIPSGSTRAVYTVIDEMDSGGRIVREDEVTEGDGTTPGGGATEPAGGRELLGVFNFIPGSVGMAAQADFPERACSAGENTDRRDINGMLLFIQRITPLNETVVQSPVDGFYPDNPNAIFIRSLGGSAFCQYTATDEDIFFERVIDPPAGG